MKELSIEEKARHYDEAIERARKEYKNHEAFKGFREMLVCIFPELKKESEDERIRKGLLYVIEHHPTLPTEETEEYIAWLEKQGQTFTQKDVDDAYLKGVCDTKQELEKQGEQKPNDKIESFDKYEGLTDFERTLTDICIGWIGEELGWKQYIKDNADVLLKIAIEKFNSVQDVPFEQKPAEWSEEDDYNAERLLCLLTNQQDNYPQLSCDFQDIEGIKDWVKSLKDRRT